jgi:hypothetical protein
MSPLFFSDSITAETPRGKVFVLVPLFSFDDEHSLCVILGKWNEQ